jgi:dihydroorotate dehydrogenase
MTLYSVARSVLFQLSAEAAHELTLEGLAAGARLGLLPALAPKVANLPITVMGIEFPNPVGLAAGLDKNASAVDGLAALGFGFVEVGTVTPRAQPGNPKPRIFRLPKAQAIINRMGFNNKGVDHLVANVKKAKFKGVLGINIGKNFDTPVEDAAADYIICMQKVYAYASYIVVNISSPNTPGLRDLQYGESLTQLLIALKHEQAVLENTHGRYVPLAVKIAPDMDDEQLQGVAHCLLEQKMDAVIATNTTLSRDDVAELEFGDEVGGLSGLPVKDKATQTIADLYAILGEQVPIIGVGGINSGSDALEKLAAGAKLVQVYSGLIYQGPGLVKQCVEACRNVIKV